MHDFVKYSVEHLLRLRENVPYLFDVIDFEKYINSPLYQLFNDTGTDFGKGVYFARDASFSVGYANNSQVGVGNRCMYVGKVLVGQYCKGTNRQSVVPPPKDPSKQEVLFDSVVNDAGNRRPYLWYSLTISAILNILSNFNDRRKFYYCFVC